MSATLRLGAPRCNIGIQKAFSSDCFNRFEHYALKKILFVSALALNGRFIFTYSVVMPITRKLGATDKQASLGCLFHHPSVHLPCRSKRPSEVVQLGACTEDAGSGNGIPRAGIETPAMICAYLADPA